MLLHFQTLSLSQYSINSTNATWFGQLQPFPYTEKPTYRGSKAGECSAYTAKDNRSSLLEMTQALHPSSALRITQLSVALISLLKF